MSPSDHVSLIDVVQRRASDPKASAFVAASPKAGPGVVEGITVNGTDVALSPTRLAAFNRIEYVSPFVSPSMVQVRPLVELHDATSVPLSAAIAETLRIGDPPSLSGVDHVTTTAPAVATSPMLSGTLGTSAGVVASEAAEGELGPLALIATTENVYATPLVKPSTVQNVAPLVEQVAPPGLAVTR